MKEKTIKNKVSFDEYSKAMKEIITYDSLTDRQLKKMSMDELSKWETKKDEALKIKLQYEKEKRENMSYMQN